MMAVSARCSRGYAAGTLRSVRPLALMDSGRASGSLMTDFNWPEMYGWLMRPV